jgi:hypothetical protein
MSPYRSRRPLLSEVKFRAEIAAIAPADVEFEPTALIIDEGEPQGAIATDSPVPAAIWICNTIGIAAHTCEMFVSNADDIVVEIVERIAHVPQEFSAAFIFSVPRRRDGVIGVFEPPDRVQFFPRAEFLGLMGDVVEHGCRLVGWIRRGRAWVLSGSRGGSPHERHQNYHGKQ